VSDICLKDVWDQPPHNNPGLLGKCCCTCANHFKDYSHPGTDGKKASEQRGWICCPEPGHAYSGWTEHGMCEMYWKKKG